MAQETWSWAFTSLQAALVGYKEQVAANPALSDEQIFKKVSLECYPFSGRENWPYKAWLNVIQRLKQVPRAVLLTCTAKQAEKLIRKQPQRDTAHGSSESQPMLAGLED